ncbi:uncharacterized protein BDZ99DRAFT_565970 [Mytilinidion resinicola]|uniref:Uncharacterized protein n=1 Tax=Mytilinidion resinicola TaxID=574789 RepID=A0A6A6Z5U5_9PEZI|nr:uncharacterized protein BDZ99DRAFT_565970 [Mytilinidion resinicola]KAF2816099.1 hypothetical protein BDZ99DRAFT_565970 [Mytilinidion resinicola]
MRFSAFSLFALSSLFVSSLAAPTSLQIRDVAVAEVEQRDTSVVAVEERTLPEIVVIVDALVTEVFSYTASINVTISSCEGISIDLGKKIKIIADIQVEIQKILSAFSLASLKIYKLKFIELIEADLKLVISLAIKVFIEIICTLLHAVAVLKITIIELLGWTLTLFLHTYISFLLAIGGVVANFIVNIKIGFQIYLVLIGKVFVDFGPLLAACK